MADTVSSRFRIKIPSKPIFLNPRINPSQSVRKVFLYAAVNGSSACASLPFPSCKITAFTRFPSGVIYSFRSCPHTLQTPISTQNPKRASPASVFNASTHATASAASEHTPRIRCPPTFRHMFFSNIFTLCVLASSSKDR